MLYNMHTLNGFLADYEGGRTDTGIDCLFPEGADKLRTSSKKYLH